MIDVASAADMIRISNNRSWVEAQRGGKPVSVEVKYPMVFRGIKKS